MKKIVVAGIAAMLAFAGAAAEKLTMLVNEAKTEDPGFEVKQYQFVGGQDVVKADVGGGVAVITALKEGRATLKLLGDGGMEETFDITVGDNLGQVMRHLMAELDEVDGLQVSKVGTSLVVRGELNDPAQWQLVKKTLSHGDYSRVVKDQTKFRVRADTLKNFYTEIRNAGFEITEDASEAQGGKLFVKYGDGSIIISGTVYSAGDVQKVMRIVRNNRTWLRLEGEDAGGDSRYEWKPVCTVDLSEDNRLLHMDVVLLDYTETTGKNFGMQNFEDTAPTARLSFGRLLDFLNNGTKGGAGDKTFALDLNLGSVLKFLKTNNITRHTLGGYLRFKSNDPAAATLRIGGTLHVKLRSMEESDFKTIEYGFEVTKAAANLTHDGKGVDVKLDISQKVPTPIHGDYDEGYDVSEYKYNPAVVCPLGKTVVIGGYRDFSESTTPSSGFPVVRNIPILSWFVAGEGEDKSDKKIMMLVSVREVNAGEEAVEDAPLPYEESKNLPVEVQIENKDRLEKRKRWSGWLYWLNWFTP